ncbi:MAG: hypothetical protein K2X69_04915, partial [Silvanigrellaceae bacterium]|nr:hypothetical protein [Silvanigrellaceae bacterium]
SFLLSSADFRLVAHSVPKDDWTIPRVIETKYFDFALHRLFELVWHSIKEVELKIIYLLT